MQILDRVVRMNVPEELIYSFEQANGDPRDLTAYNGTPKLEVKRHGVVHALVNASFSGSPTLGVVTVPAYTFATAGVWQVQFFVQNLAGSTKLFGEPMQVRVVKNVEDADLDELLRY